MSNEAGLGALVQEIRQASENIASGDARTKQRIDELTQSVNEIYRTQGRPGAEITKDDNTSAARKDARELCILKHDLDVPKNAANRPAYEPTSAEVDNALLHRKALRNLIRHRDPARLDQLERKSLTSFSFGANSFILAPQMSDRVLSCLVDESDLSGLVDVQNISAASLKMFIDNQRMLDAAWSCEAGCFANDPYPDLSEGLGEMEIKAETLRFVVCAGSDLLQDASFDVESWLLRKVSDGFRRTINLSSLLGGGIGKPLGLLNPAGGVPICDASVDAVRIARTHGSEDVDIPMTDALAAAIDAMPRLQPVNGVLPLTFLHTERGKVRSNKALGNDFAG